MRRKVREQRARVRHALDELRHQIGLARGTAHNTREEAESELAKLEVEQLLLRTGFEQAANNPDLAEPLSNPVAPEVLAQLREIRGRFYQQWADGPTELRELVAEAAPGPAGDPPGQWLGRVGTDPGTSAPELWRIGSATAESTVTDSGPRSDSNFDVAVPLLDASHLTITSAPDTRSRVDSFVENLLLRVLSTFEPGAVRIHLWDNERLTAVLPGLYALSRTSAVTVHDPTRLVDLLDELAGQVRRIHHHLMQAGYPSLQAMRRATGQRTEPWRIAVLFGSGEELAQEQLRDLKRIASGALAVGISLILVDVPTALTGTVETVRFLDEQRAVTSMTGPDLVVDLDPPLPSAQVTQATHRIAEALLTKQGGPRSFHDLLPTESGGQQSATELRAPVGFYEGEAVDVVLGDATPHMLIGGPSGSGKTNFLFTLIGSLTARYSPDELALYLLDFKEGVSFAGLAPGRKDESWLPHARLVGINVNTDREFGLALLRFLTDELRRRSAAAKEYEVTNLADLRAQDPEGHWPRIVAVIDEFQYLFGERDNVTALATSLLEDLARRGRAQGIHLVLASQDIAGIEAFWGKPAIFEQCTLRVAMPKARRVLAETNEAAVTAPRWHAVINHDSGIPHGNALAHLPNAGGPEAFPALQRSLWQRYAGNHRPRLFDGAAAPRLEESAAFTALAPVARPQALVGQSIDVSDTAHGVDLSAAPGRNFAVLGNSTREALSIMDSAVRSLARQYQSDSVEFLVNCPIEACLPAVTATADSLREEGHPVHTVPSEKLTEQIGELVVDSIPDTTRFLVLYGVDAVLPTLEQSEPGKPSGLDQLRTLLKHGPARDLHVLGWWRGVARLKDTLGFGGTDDIGAWTALNVQGSELAAFSAGAVVHWAPRPGRALFFDRSTHSSPEVIIPFDREGAADE